jgi:hypothetical protein
MAEMRTVVREMRGIPFFLLQEYLEEMGGTVVSDDLVEGPGWIMKMTRMEPFRLGSLSIGQTRMELQIEEHLADDFIKRFGLKTLRAGG